MAPPALPRGSICLRQAPFGGGFRDQGHVDPSGLFSETHHLILFVHGYAVSRSAAESAYGGFLANLDRAWRGMAAAVYWPGDSWQTGQGSDRRSRWDLRPVLSYSFMPERAKEGAGKLEAALTKALKRRRAMGLRKPLSLYFVAHSMGCRLILELIKQIRALNHDRIELEMTALMAPAVARYKVGSYRGRDGDLRPAILAAKRVRVYHSEADGVLFWSFKLGQMMELDFPSGLGDREALGVGGGQGDGIVNREYGLGHSQYWSSRDVADDLNAALRELQPRIFRPGIAPPRLQQGRGLGGRAVAGRSIAASVPVPPARPERILCSASV